MPRKPRIHYPGALYHVIVKGNNGDNAFLEPAQKEKYLRLIARYKEKFGFMLHAFCIMNNHAHMLIRVQEESLSRIMQGLQQTYTQWYNRKYDRTGHVFQQRYKAFLCGKDSYLLELVRYIHNNPVRAKLSGGFYYKWSSHLNYLGIETGGIVDTADILSLFSNRNEEALKQYLEFINQDTWDIGFESFEAIQPERPETPMYAPIEKENHELSKGLSLDEIIEKVCLGEKVSLEIIRSKTRVQKVADIRKAIILIGKRHVEVSDSVLAKKLALAPSMVSKVKSGNFKRTGYLDDLLREWENQNK